MKRCVVFLFLLLLVSFKPDKEPDWKEKTSNPEWIHRAIKQVTDMMVHDIYSPPVASRTYAYISVAAYEAARHADTSYQSLAGQLQDLQPFPQPDATKEQSFTLSAVTAILTVGKAMVVSESETEAFLQKLQQGFREAGIPEAVFENAVAYGKAVADHVLAWAAKDNYKQTRSFPRYDISAGDAYWKPTPPAYIKAVEPHWSRIRPFLIDSAQQFKPLPPSPFATDKKSLFYKEAKEVHDIGVKLTDGQKLIANFWDCNPFKMNINGHVMFATKKISPGGHWINITAQVCNKAKADFVRTAAAYANVSLAIADGFISCWDEKYRSNVIRPETYINAYISESWRPLLQTPPFPEYTSGHSVVSTAAAIVLSRLFGDGFAFTDDTEVAFGLPVRQFKSFKQAASEAAISRLYGGIHYRPAIENGVAQGRKIGNFYIEHLQLKKRKPV